jgi:hypothetical protein
MPVPGAMPTWQTATSAAADATLAATWSFACPAVAAGDLLVAQLLLRTDDLDGTGVCNTPGWLPFAGNPYGGASGARQALFYKVANGAEGGTQISFTTAGGVTNDLRHGRIWRFAAADGFADPPIEAVAAAAGTAATVAAPTVTPAGANRLAVCMIATGSASAPGGLTGEAGGDWTPLGVAVTTTVGGDGSLSAQSSLQAAGGQISGGTGAFTTTVSPHWTAVGFALAPADVADPVEIHGTAAAGASGQAGAAASAKAAAIAGAGASRQAGAAVAGGGLRARVPSRVSLRAGP